MFNVCLFFYFYFLFCINVIENQTIVMGSLGSINSIRTEQLERVHLQLKTNVLFFYFSSSVSAFLIEY